ncbi:hypothetical protein [Roseinatronobacter sp.]
MNRQIIIRGTAIAIAGIAASIFAAKEFIGDGQQQTARTHTQTKPTAEHGNGGVVGASLIGAGSLAAEPENPAPASADATIEPVLQLAADPAPAEMSPAISAEQPELVLGALDADLRSDNTPRLDADFRPDLALELAEAVLDQRPADCTAHMTLEPSIDALLNMTIVAPCNMLERVVVSHGDLAFSAYTDENGTVSAYIPALSEDASVDAYLEDGTMLQARALVEDVALHHRVIVQWTGDFGLSLHAFHRDAAYGSSGHVHASSPFDPDLQEAFIIGLGDARGPEDMLAHIYSIPTELLDAARVELEAAHDMRSCGKDVSAYILQSNGGQTAGLKELSLAMPDCGTDQGMAVIALPFEYARHAQPADAQDDALILATSQDEQALNTR